MYHRTPRLCHGARSLARGGGGPCVPRGGALLWQALLGSSWTRLQEESRSPVAEDIETRQLWREALGRWVTTSIRPSYAALAGVSLLRLEALHGCRRRSSPRTTASTSFHRGPRGRAHVPAGGSSAATEPHETRGEGHPRRPGGEAHAARARRGVAREGREAT